MTYQSKNIFKFYISRDNEMNLDLCRTEATAAASYIVIHIFKHKFLYSINFSVPLAGWVPEVVSSHVVM